MLRNYLKIAIRSLMRNKSYTFINVAGLSLGITTCLIIFLIIRYELSFDSFHSKADRIYRIVHDSENASGVEHNSVTPYPFANAYRNDFPGVGTVTQFHFHNESLVIIGDDKSRVTNIAFVDSSFFDVFDFELIGGDAKLSLNQPGKVFLSEEYANTLPDKNVRHIKLDNLLDLEVAGIIKTPPSPSHINFNMIVSLSTLTKDNAEQFLGFPMDQWGINSSGFSYILLQEGQSKEQIERNLPSFVKKYYSEEEARQQTYLLKPLTGIHFDSDYSENPGTASTSLSVLIILGFIALFILVIACVNFINLATALSIKKAKEVGVRKTLGAQRNQLAFQYLSEAFLLTVFAAVISLGVAEFASPLVGSFLEKNISVNLISNPTILGFLIGIVFLTSLLSGFYPAMVLARFNPVKALKSKLSAQSNSSVTLRKSLVVLQFFIAQVLIICTLVVSSQMRFFRDTPLGFAKDAIISVPIPDNKRETLEAFRNKLATERHVIDLTYSLAAPMGEYNFGTSMFQTEKGEEEKYNVRIKPIDVHYKDVYDLKLIEGRWFYESDQKLADNEKREDREYSYVVNEATVRTLGFATPLDAIGKNITTGLNDIEAPIIGVIKDFHTSSLHNELEPLILLTFPSLFYEAGIKISSENTATTLKFIEQSWSELYPEYLFRYTFLNDYVARQYREEERMFTLFEVFAGIAIFIGCLGLYGLASFMANQKTKEVAIRKTLGASVSQIVVLFSREFVLLVLLAFALAAPVAWYAMNGWLQSFAYRTDVSWTVFMFGVLFTLIITLLTVGYRSLRAASSNPVNALKTE